MVDNSKNENPFGEVISMEHHIDDLSNDSAPNNAVETTDLSLWYGSFQALFNVNFKVKQGLVTSLIGPSGCGKSTLLRSVNRINERFGYVRTEGQVHVLGQDIYASTVDKTQVRSQIGMVFQRPNPLPVTIRKNILFGYHLKYSDRVAASLADDLVEKSLREVLLWDDLKDKLNHSALSLSLEQQQKLCIARLLPVKPKVILMDEPCSALDPEATAAIEDLIWELRGEYTILIVTHNMAQARRASDECAFMLMGKMVEHGRTEDIFVTPDHQQTADYIEGKFG